MKKQNNTVNWLCYPCIAKGSISMILELPNAPKHAIGTWIAAQVAGKKPFPIHDELNDHTGSGKVFYLSREADFEEDLIPVFDKYDTNVDNIFTRDPHYLNEKGEYEDTMPNTICDKNVDEILAAEPELIIFDGLQSFIGDADINSETEMKALFDSLAQKIERTDTAVLILHYVDKMPVTTDEIAKVQAPWNTIDSISAGMVVGNKPYNDVNSELFGMV